MLRHTAIKVLTNSMFEGDIGLYIGENICRETAPYDRPGNLYVDIVDGLLSVALGMSMCTNRRIFVFCDDAYFLRNISEALHIAVSKCENINLVILASGAYDTSKTIPTIFNSIMSPHGMLFNMGFVVHDYTKHFKLSKNPVKEIRAIWSRVKGPLSVVLPVEVSNNKKFDPLPDELRNNFLRTTDFTLNPDIPTYQFVPPVSLEDVFERTNRDLKEEYINGL